MSKINEKLGLKPAGARRLMKLPPDRALRARLTAAKCPACQRTGAMLKPKYRGAGVGVFCSWCNHAWELREPGEED